MREHKVESPADVRALGVIDLETMQKYLNFHYSVTIDLFGSDASSNAATYYTTGLKGRYDETKDRRRSRADRRGVSGVRGGGRIKSWRRKFRR